MTPEGGRDYTLNVRVSGTGPLMIKINCGAFPVSAGWAVMPKIHLAVMRENNGVIYNDTLCGRESSHVEEANRDDAQVKIDCKICLKIMADKSHWRYRKWLQA